MSGPGDKKRPPPELRGSGPSAPPAALGVPIVTGRVEPEKELNPFNRLVNGPVIVMAGGIEYEGTLTGADERLLYLQMLSGPKAIALEAVTSVRHPDDKGPTLDKVDEVNREFFEDPGDLAPGVAPGPDDEPGEG